MTTTSQSLVEAVVGVLLAPGATAAGARVYAPRDWPSWDAITPVLFVSAPRERKESLGRNAPQFTVTTTIRVWIRASAAGVANDGSAGTVQAELMNLQRQVEIAVINSLTTTLSIQQFASVSSELAFDSTGEKHLGALVMDFEVEFFQSWQDFAPIASTPLTDVQIVASNLPPAGADVVLPQI